MDLGLQSKVALVAGASRGIGAAIARSLGREGCRLILCARGEERLRETAAAIATETAVDVLPVAADVTAAGSGELLVAAAHERFGRLDLVVHNAGGNRRGALVETTDEGWREIFELNVLAGVRLARAAVPELRRQPGAAILFVSSIFGREAGGPGLSIYNATKSALISAAKILALELAPEGIRVNSIAPGSIRFPGSSWDERCKKEPEAMAEFVRRNLPMGRFGTAEEIADVATFLLSERAGWITGACLNVDGGQSRSLI